MQTQRGVRIFGHRFHGDTANFIQRLTPDDRTRPTEEGRIPHIVAVLHQAVEQRTFVRRFTETPQVTFKRVWREEVVRRLHHRQLFILQEPAHGHLQERARRHVVAVEDGDELAFRQLQRVVDVPRFCMFMRCTRDILNADVFRKLAKFFTGAVIKDPHFHLVFRPVDTE